MIDKAFKKVVELHKSGSQFIKKVSIDEGDRYYSGHGTDYIVELPDMTLNIGYMYITEDDDDWAQAESYEVKWNKLNGEDISDTDAFEILNSITSVAREQKLNSIL